MTSRTHPHHRSVGCRRGYSLVELLTAAMIIALATIAVVAVIRKGREIQVLDHHRRMARAVLRSRLDTDYDYRNYDTIKDGTLSETVTLDPRSGNPLTGQVTATVTTQNTSVGGTTIPIKQISMKIVWTEPEGDVDSIELEKWIADVN